MLIEIYTTPTVKFKVMERYKVLKKLGDGSQGVAYLANDTISSRTVVVKKLPSGSRSSEEMRLGKHIKHPNIIECFDAFEEADFVYLAMNYAEGGDLETFLDCLRESNEVPPLPVSLRWFTQIATACLHCHGCQLIHRDVKPSNVFLSKDLKTAYLGDFGVAKQLGASKTSTSTFVGSPVWLAPEVVSGQAYDAHSDGWGLGCVLYELVTGKSPFDATNFAALVMRICSGEYDTLPTTVPAHVRNAIAGLLTVDTKKRWSVAKVLASHEDFDVNLPLPPGFGVAAPKEGLKTWIDARSRDLEELEKFNNPTSPKGFNEPKWGAPKNDVYNEPKWGAPKGEVGLQTWMDDTLQQLDEFEQILGKDKKVTPVSSPTSAPKVPISRPLSKSDNLNSNRAKRQLVVEPAEPTPAQIALQKQQEREARREKDLQELRMRMKEGRKEAAKEQSPLNVDVRTPAIKSPVGPPLVPSGRRQSPQLSTPTAASSSPSEPQILAGRRRSQAPQEPFFRAPSPPSPPPPQPQEKDTRAAAAADKRLKQREEMLALIQRQRNQARQNGGDPSNVNVEIVLPANLRNLPENRL